MLVEAGSGMLRRLSIKQKIIMGFGAIGGLLIIACTLAYIALSHISDSNKQVREVTLPSQHAVEALKLQELRLAMQVAQTFNMQTHDEVTNASSQIQSTLVQRHELTNQLNSKLAHAPELKALLVKTEKNMSKLEQAVNDMLSLKLSLIETQNSLDLTLQKLIGNRQKASDAMLSIELVENAPQVQLEEMIGTGFRIDDALFTLDNNIQQIINLPKEKIESHISDVSFIIKDIENNFVFLQRQSQGVDIGGVFSEFSAALKLLNQLLINPGEAYDLLNERARLEADVVVKYREAESYSQSVLNSLSKMRDKTKLSLTMSQQSTEELIKNAKTGSILVVLTLVGLAIIIATSTSRAMLIPLLSVNKVLNYLAVGDFSLDIKKRSDDEFGNLVDNIKKVQTSLSDLLHDINLKISELNAFSEKSLQENNGLAGRSSSQMARMDDATNLAQAVSKSAVQVSLSAKQSLDSLMQANEFGAQASNVVVDNQSHIQSLENKMNQAVEVMSSLSEHSDNIGSILDTIVSIAEQTNLLALNAAIEAARAGEQGRGFAVVADEVRTLASRTQDSTEEINKMISSLQHDTKRAAEIINSGQADVSECVAQIKVLAMDIDQISNSLVEVNGLSKQVAEYAHLQEEDCQRIETVMLEAKEVASCNVSSTKALAKDAESLTNLARFLAQLVARFKL
ncbi:methyl-accepting chemotaxis protein [Pseudoalteromonas luteoviolacea]|uniref:methyl-accepting chemotaxis protein n=1 Tax=Pseudoalteromonas luteoviolacea TaxID=43657 RepID=UPI0031BA14E6|nr:methyl-accepting chemotaxis protein [Pseudoalteromonas luteoviolacea]